MRPGEQSRPAMDPINYLPQGSQRLPSHGDNVHSPAGPWATGAHSLAPPAWPAMSSVAPLYFSPAPPRPHASPDPTHFGLQGALPHPDRNVRGAQQHQQDGLPSLPTPPGDPYDPAIHSLASRISSQGAPVLQHGDMSAQGLGAAASQPQALVNLGLPGAAVDQNSSHLSLFSSPGRLANPYNQQIWNFSHPHPPHFALSPYRRSGPSLSPQATARPNRPSVATSSSAAPAPRLHDSSGLPSPASDRRRHNYTRGRRYLSVRHIASDPLDDRNRHLMADSADGRPSRRASRSSPSPWDESAMRQLQVARGAASSKMIASKTALQSLQSVDIRSLSDNEKTCVICYNDYGVASPEGINEAPLRLPKCKHIFGDHCIKKWFEDSDSCPYCRDKLPSEPKCLPGSALTFLNMMRLRGYPIPTGIPEHLLARIMGGAVDDDDMASPVAGSQGRTAERRSPPDDSSGEDRRRTRQRRAGPAPSDSPPSMSRRAQLTDHAVSWTATPADVPQTWQSRQPHRHAGAALPTSGQAEPGPEAASTIHQASAHGAAAERATGSHPVFETTMSATTISVRTQPRVGTPLHGHDAQGQQETSLVGSRYHEVQIFNPLRAHSRSSLGMGQNTNTAVSPVRVGQGPQAGPQAGSDGTEQQAALTTQAASSSLFGATRNRPW